MSSISDHDLIVRIDERVTEIKKEIIALKAETKNDINKIHDRVDVMTHNCVAHGTDIELSKNFIKNHNKLHDKLDQRTIGLGGGVGVLAATVFHTVKEFIK